MKRFVQILHVDPRLASRYGHLVKGEPHPSTGPFGHPAAARVIDKDAAHHLRRQREEVGPVLPAGPLLVHQAQVGLVHEGRGLEGVSSALSAHPLRGALIQLPIQRCEQRIASGVVPAAPGPQQSGDIASRLGQIRLESSES